MLQTLAPSFRFRVSGFCKDIENQRITLKIYNQGLELIDEDNKNLVGEIANHFIPRADEEVSKVLLFSA